MGQQEVWLGLPLGAGKIEQTLLGQITFGNTLSRLFHVSGGLAPYYQPAFNPSSCCLHLFGPRMQDQMAWELLSLEAMMWAM